MKHDHNKIISPHN